MEVRLALEFGGLGQGLAQVRGWQHSTGMVLGFRVDPQVEEGTLGGGLPQGRHVGLLKAIVRLLLLMGSRTRNMMEGKMRLWFRHYIIQIST